MIMKRILALASICMLATSGVCADNNSNEADQKWLQAVEKKIVAGESKVSTPVAERVDLLKRWATDNGYTAQVVQADNNYRIELSKSLAQQ
jgi:hypothetical protein